MIDTKLELAYANWHVERKEGEGIDAYVRRAYDETVDYIERYPDKPGTESFFVLVAAID